MELITVKTAGYPKNAINANVQSRHSDCIIGLQYLSEIYADLHRVSQKGLSVIQLCSKSKGKRSDASSQPAIPAATPDDSKLSNVLEASLVGAEIEKVHVAIEKARHLADSTGHYMTLNLEDVEKHPGFIITNYIDLPLGCLKSSRDSVDTEYLKRNRIFSFACRHGWMMLCILLHSQSFRVACHNFDEKIWEGINVAIQNNIHSLVMFAQVRGIDWREAMTRQGRLLLTDAEIKAPFVLPPCHPHLISLSLAGRPRLIKINGHVIENIDECFWTKRLISENEQSKRHPLPWPEDPSKISSEDAIFRERGLECLDLINYNTVRSLEASIHEPLVEILEVPKLGRGVRTLEKIEKGRIVGEYTGIIRSSKYIGDQDYSALMRVCDPYTNKKRYDYLVSACHRGNWTRFINHACDAPLTFANTIIDEKHRLVIKSRRNIEAFEHLTLDYGNAYFLPGECKCGAANCRFKGPAPDGPTTWAPGLDSYDDTEDAFDFDKFTSNSNSGGRLETFTSKSNGQAVYSCGKGNEATPEIRMSVELAEMDRTKRKYGVDNHQTERPKKRAKKF